MPNKIKRILYIVIFALALVPALNVLPGSVARAQGPADWTWLSVDVDGDGLPNQVEIEGWCNAVGCFTTDPLDADSDDDGLTDGEEKLFDSGPTQGDSPGIYVIYQDTFRTQEYYPWQPYGHKLIARGDNFDPPRPDPLDVQSGHGTDLDAVVVRRGTTFYVGGAPGVALRIAKSNSSLTTLSPTWEPYYKMWRVRVPSDSRVGRYRLTLGDRGLDLFVIFELPSPFGELTQGAIDRFVYDDNPSQNRDEVSILLGDGQYDYPYGFVAEGHSYRFLNQQYQRFMLEDYIISAINGLSNQRSAADALTDRVDQLTVFRNPRVLLDSWKVLHPGNDVRQQCSNVSGLLSAFNRAAGIPARPVMVDWRNSSFDHATEIWLNGAWRVYRGYRYIEMAEYPDDRRLGCSASVWPACGTNKYESRSSWGQGHYPPWHSGGGGGGNVIVLADDRWSGSGLAFRWPSWDVAIINLYPSRLMTQLAVYWSSFGWTQEPVNIGAPGWPPPPSGISGADVGVTSQPGGGFDFQSPQVQVGQVVAEYGRDLNSNGQYEQLVLEVEVTATQAGNYWLLGQLVAKQPEEALIGAGGILAEAYTSASLVEGSQRVQLVFDGRDIALKRVEGPYMLGGVWITDLPDPGPNEFMVDSLAYRGFLHTTAAYRAVDFETYGAMLSGNYSAYDVDSDGNGRSDTLVVTTGINVYQTPPGSYTVRAALYDNQGQFIGPSTWSGTGPEVSLRFENVAGTLGPYTLRDLDLFDPAGQSIDYIPEAYTISPMAALADPERISLDLLPAGATELMAMGAAVTPTRVFTESLVDGNLRVQAEVQVAEAGAYKLEGWLVDSNGGLVTWAMGQPASLGVGKRVLSLTFPGAAIRARGMVGPYRLVALKVLAGGPGYQVLDKVDVALTTRAYTLDQFAAGQVTLFEDFVENDGAHWVAGGAWRIIQDVSHSPSHAWYASNDDAVLRLARPLDLSGKSPVGLRFQTAYRLSTDADRGYLEASSDGLTWSILKTFSGERAWSTQIVDLTAYAGYKTVYLRFRLSSSGGAANDGWVIDDVLVAGRLPSIYLPLIVDSR